MVGFDFFGLDLIVMNLFKFIGSVQGLYVLILIFILCPDFFRLILILEVDLDF